MANLYTKEVIVGMIYVVHVVKSKNKKKIHALVIELFHWKCLTAG